MICNPVTRNMMISPTFPSRLSKREIVSRMLINNDTRFVQSSFQARNVELRGSSALVLLLALQLDGLGDLLAC